MSEQSHLTTLYDLVLAMGSEVSLPPLLRSVLGRFLYQTGFPAGIICLDDSMDPDDFRVPGSAEEIELAVHATLGDPALEELRGRSFRVRSSWVADPSAYLSESDGSAELGVPGAAYPVVLRLRIPRMGVLLLLGEEGMAQDPVLTRVFEPVMGNLARQAYLAYRHDEHTRFLQRDLNRAVSGLVRFKAALDASEECVVLVDGRGDRVVDVNLGAVRLTGFGREALEGDRVSRIVPDGVMERIRAAQSVAREETSGPSDLNDRFTTEITRHDGTRVPVEMSISPVCDHEGGPGTVILVARDVTERLSHELEMEAHRHHLEEQVAQRTAELAEKMVELRRSNEELEQFAYVASHDLQEPLRMVSSFTQLLAKRYGDKLDDDGMEFIRFAVDGANRMQALIKALLRYSRVGTRGGDFVDVDMNEVADRVVRDLSLAAAEAGAEFEVGSLP
ncbi:MAG: PAS domain S-box protein, partial [Gemmatimonadota bacterium]|nr:PAS domain S-box protein [Gemmatimonadota bacterium]